MKPVRDRKTMNGNRYKLLRRYPDYNLIVANKIGVLMQKDLKLMLIVCGKPNNPLIKEYLSKKLLEKDLELLKSSMISVIPLLQRM